MMMMVVMVMMMMERKGQSVNDREGPAGTGGVSFETNSRSTTDLKTERGDLSFYIDGVFVLSICLTERRTEKMEKEKKEFEEEEK